ncbi:MAG: hypothetical protein HY000_14710 [Planctomycetes bacterium]|nr:hypothetical protein [Planctomycetota bacterium]
MPRQNSSAARALSAKQRRLLIDTDPGVRYWGAVGLQAASDDARVAQDDLQRALGDSA